jgi:hypothetical protein
MIDQNILEANSRSANQEIRCLLCSQTVDYRVQKDNSKLQ